MSRYPPLDEIRLPGGHAEGPPGRPVVEEAVRKSQNLFAGRHDLGFLDADSRAPRTALTRMVLSVDIRKRTPTDFRPPEPFLAGPRV